MGWLLTVLEFIYLFLVLWLLYTEIKGAGYAYPNPKKARMMIKFANIKKSDIAYDLGSGFGGLVFRAAKHAKKVIGIEYDPLRFLISLFRAKISNRKNVKFIRGDLLKQDFSDATVILLFLRQGINQKLKPTLSKLKKGTRIVSYIWTFEGWKPIKEDKKLRIHMYVIGKSNK
jgi:SAM-dependent methyltransferase